MKNSRKNTTFYIEVIALLLLLLFAISVLVQVFGSAQRMGNEAKELTIAVPLAQNTIEIFTASPSIEAIAKALGENAVVNDNKVTMYYNENGDIANRKIAYFTLELSINSNNKMQKGIVIIRQGEREIYSLEAEAYSK